MAISASLKLGCGASSAFNTSGGTQNSCDNDEVLSRKGLLGLRRGHPRLQRTATGRYRVEVRLPYTHRARGFLFRLQPNQPIQMPF
jgi:hypothetical protein